MTKKPRQYAYDFINAKTDQARAAAVAGCPPKLQGLVRLHVKLWRQRFAAEVARRKLTEAERVDRDLARQAKKQLRAMLPPAEEYEKDWRGRPL